MGSKTGNADVKLIISAQNQASDALNDVVSSLNDLKDAQGGVASGAKKVGNGLAEIATFAAKTDKAFADISGKADNAEKAFKRQAQAIENERQTLVALEAQLRAAQKARQDLAATPVTARSSVTGFDSGKTAADSASVFKKAFAEQDAAVKSVDAAIAGLNKSIDRSVKSISSLEASQVTARSSLQKLGSTVIALQHQQADANAEMLLYSDSMEQAATAGERLSAVQAQINRLSGVSRDTPKSARESAAILQEVAARDELIQKLKAQQAAEAEEARTREAQSRASMFLPGSTVGGKSARESAAVFEQINAELDGVAANLRGQLNPLSSIEGHYEKQRQQLKQLIATQRVSRVEAEAMAALINRQEINAKASAGAGGLPFGLNSNNFRNLSFQVNDVVTSLALGMRPGQVLLQQGGQILQLFPKVNEQIGLAFRNPALLAAAAVITTIVLAVKRLSDEADRLRQFNAELAVSADGKSYNAAGLEKQVQLLHKLGLSYDEAAAAITTFRKAGLNTDQMDEFGKTARDLSKIFGVEIPEAAKLTVEAFTNGFEAVAKLDKEYEFLTASQYTSIRAMFEAGDAIGAQSRAFDIFQSKLAAAAKATDGPWTQSWKNLKGAFNDFIDAIADSEAIKLLIKLVDGLAVSVNLLTNAMRKGTGPIGDFLIGGVPRVAAKYASGAYDNIGSAPSANPTGSQRDPASMSQDGKGMSGANIEEQTKLAADYTHELDKQLLVTKDLTDAEKVRKAGLDKVTAAQNAGISDPGLLEDIRKKAELVEQTRVNIEKAAKARQLEATLASDALVSDTASARSLSKILDDIERKADTRLAKVREARAAGVTAVNGQSLGDYERQINAQTEIAKQLATQKFYADQLAALDKQRTDAAQAIADKVKSGTITQEDAATKLNDLNAELAPQYAELARAAKSIKDSFNGAAIPPATQAVIDQLSTGGADAIARNAAATKQIMQDAANEAERTVSALSSMRGALQQRLAIETAAGSDTSVLDELQRKLDGVNAKLKDAAINAAKLFDKLGGPDAQAKAENLLTVAANTAVVKNEIFSTTTAAQAFGAALRGLSDNFISKIRETGDVLGSLRDAFRQFASDFLMRIAQMILQQAIFNALKAANNGSSTAGIIGTVISAFGASHTGGTITQGGSAMTRKVNPGVFANAMRYHGGGVAGLKPGEVPTILEVGERVRTQEQEAALQQQLASGGNSTATNVKIVNAIDSGSFVSEGLNTPVGGKAFLNHIRANQRSVRAAIGI